MAATSQVSDAVFELDDLRGAGGIVVSFTVPLSIVTHVELATLDLDSYLPPPGRAPAADASAIASVTPILALLGPSIGLKLKVARIDWPGRRSPASMSTSRARPARFG